MRGVESMLEICEHSRFELSAAGRGLVLLAREAPDDPVDGAAGAVEELTVKACR